jgi:hypothetical protein
MGTTRFSAIALGGLLIAGMFVPASLRAEQTAPAQPPPPLQQAAPTTPRVIQIAPQGQAQQPAPSAQQQPPVQQAAPAMAQERARP